MNFTVDDVRLAAGSSSPPYEFSEYELCLVLEGQSLEKRGSREFLYEAADLAFNTPGEAHAFEAGPAGLRYVSIVFDGGLVKLASDLELKPSLARRDPKWTWLAVRFYHFANRSVSESELLEAQSLGLEILALAARRIPGADDREWLPRFQQWLGDRPAGPYSLTHLAAELGLHPVTLTRGVRSAYRCTIGELLRGQQVSRAQQLLAGTKLPLAEIALAAGFCDQSHMNRAFAAILGTTPLRFRTAVG